MSKKVQEFEEYGESKTLVVLLHAYEHTPDHFIHVRNAIMETWNDVDIFTPHLPLSTCSLANPIIIVRSLLEKIDALWAEHITKHEIPYQNIIIVGHSIGALLGRKLYVYACGEITKAPFETDVGSTTKREWAEKVERIVLLAAINRGWSISPHMSIPRAILYTLGSIVSSLLILITNYKPTVFNVRRGAPFLTNLRIQWLAMRNASKDKGVGHALAIQLLGSIDDLVSPEDNIDLISGADFVYLDVPKTGHKNIIEMDNTSAGQGRKEKFISALTETREVLRNHCVLPQDIELPSKRYDVTDVIFVIHGIRDLGYWTNRIARRIKALGNTNQKVFETETSRYGYFPMLSFLFPWCRRAKVEWLMDQYAEALSLYPNAKFSYVGHSQGTYLLAKALTEYPCCRFKNVVFAGSVVRTDYEWSNFLKSRRVEAVLNYVASADWVVAWLPNAFQMINIQDVGGAGHKGFDSDKINQIRYVKGGHSAALEEDNWDAIASFIIEGTPVDPPEQIKEKDQADWVLLPAHMAPLIWLGVILLLFSLGSCLAPNLSLEQWKETIRFFLYLLVIYLALTKF